MIFYKETHKGKTTIWPCIITWDLYGSLSTIIISKTEY